MTSTTPTTPRLSEVARHLVIPDGIVTSNFPRVYRRLQSVGVGFDLWQQGFGTAALGCRRDGLYAATIGGVTGSLVRQVGKTYTVGNLLIGLALEFPNTRIVWTSHHNRTTTNTFRSMQGMVRRKKIAPLLAPNGIRTANGEQEIRFANGSIIMFGAREHGFGRGMDAIDVLVFDEAQILSLKALEDMVPATNQARHPHGALVFFIGTPPRPADDGEAFTAKRAKALAGQSKDGLYVEIGAEPGDDSDDRTVWSRMNPSYPARTPLESMLRMRENIPDEMSWRREAMGIWDETVRQQGVISPDIWSATGIPAADVPAGEPAAFGVDMSHDRLVTIGVCVKGDETDHVEVAAYDRADTEQSVVEWLVERAGRKIPVVIDSYSPAASLVPELETARVKVKVVSSGGDMAKACGAFYDAVNVGRLTHFAGQELLDLAVSGARKRNVGTAGGWAWDRKDGSINLAPLVAVTLAKYGADNFGRRQHSGSAYQRR